MAASDHCWAQEIFQTSTMGALLDGVYEGNVTVRELLRHGDFGLGTFNRLDGEMLVLDGVCYQLRADAVISARFAPAPSRSSIRRSGPSPRPPRISRR
ncbi:acetolactate decarboxylase [Mycobacterium avium]|jgi:alpha-acetolactate decarboxylase|nr:acetolactate decarboxylase [Mycobacterium avium]MDV3301034.1 acetolactate decarboxylase [Mycobacterium avium]